MNVCSINGCDRVVQCRGWCEAHYTRWLKSGDVRAHIPVIDKTATVVERFRRYVDVGNANDCWQWTAGLSASGYGRVGDGNRQYVLAHRLAWELANEQSVPEGLHVLHACDNRRCCNPGHLWVGTNADNVADRHAKGRDAGVDLTHCKRGHEFTAENTYVWQGHRSCHECQRIRKLERAA
jgi:hypothetical protein